MKKKKELKPEEPIYNLKKNTIYLCYDCEKDIPVTEDKEDKENLIIHGGQLCAYKNGDEKIAILKCDECYAKNQSLSNYQECLVYSRVVGYITPVKQWHPGKQEEFKERKVYTLNEITVEK